MTDLDRLDADQPHPRDTRIHLDQPLSRRHALRLAGVGGLGLLGLALSACGPNTAAPTAPTTAPVAPTAAAAKPTTAAAPTAAAAAPTTAPAAGGTSAAWDALVADARKEGKVVVSGPPSDDVRKELPD